MNFKCAGIVNDSVVDGVGLRLTVFTQGCPHNCEGCHNPDSHDPLGGHVASTEGVLEAYKTNILLDGVTLSGGEPFAQPAAMLALAKGVRALGGSVWAFSGWMVEQLVARHDRVVDELLANVDVLVDGRFVLAERDLSLHFRGSRNQRLVDVQHFLATGEVVEPILDD